MLLGCWWFLQSLILNNIFNQVQGVHDPTLTLVSEFGRLEEPSMPTSIRCASVHHRPDDIHFERTLNTGQDPNLPTNAQMRVEGEWRWLVVPPSTDPSKDRRFGVFSCRVSTHNVTTRVVTLKSPAFQIAEVIPRTEYVRTQVNGSVTLFMVRRTDSKTPLVWRHKGIRLSQGIGKEELTIDHLKTKDAGIYELFFENRRKLGRHALTRLVVTECPYGKYGRNCEFDCVPCLNGGICHEFSGQCLCPPGFGGPHCQHSCGANLFGPTCSWTCDSTNGPNGCGHFLFCLPDPYSCTCASGFMGYDCLDKCPPGRFGANCLETCRCKQDGDVCDVITGSCNQGCQDGWQGESCQMPALPGVEDLKVAKTNSAHQVHVTWGPIRSAHGHVTYNVRYRLVQVEGCEGMPVGETTWKHHLLADTEIILRHLNPFSLYELSITANSSFGLGVTVESTFVTGTASPTASPRELTVTKIRESELTFSWLPVPCNQSNGFIQSYDLQVWHLPEGMDDKAFELVEPQSHMWKVLEQMDDDGPKRINAIETKVVAGKLIPYQHYAARVRARTTSGVGPWSNGVVALTQYSVVPPPEVLLIERTARSISIGVVSTDLPPAAIRQVQVRGRAESTDNSFATALQAQPEHLVHNYTFARLQPHTKYMIQARVSTTAGWGNWSHPLTVWTDETYPQVPSVTIVRSGMDFLLLQVQRPSPSNGIVLKYRVRVAGPRTPGNLPTVPIITAMNDPEVVNYTARNLIPATRYQVNVQAATGVGWGNWSEPFDAWTGEGVPDAPGSLTLVSANGSSLLIEWTKPIMSFGSITGYEVSCSPRSSMDPLQNLTIQVSSLVTRLRLADLQPTTEYLVSVRAKNKRHSGSHVTRVFMTGLPPPPPLETFPNSATDTTVPVLIKSVTTPIGMESLYQVIVEEGQTESLDESLLTDFESAAEIGLPFYIAVQVNQTELSPLGLLLYIGDDRKYDNFWNAPLRTKTNYYFRLRVILLNGQNNMTSYSIKSKEAIAVNAVAEAQTVAQECLFYDPHCLWFPLAVVGGSIMVVWLVVSVVLLHCWLKKSPEKEKPVVPGEREQGSSTSIAWSVAYRKGFGVTNSEASTLVKDQALL